MSETEIWIVIIGMTIVTAVTRALFLIGGERTVLPERARAMRRAGGGTGRRRAARRARNAGRAVVRVVQPSVLRGARRPRLVPVAAQHARHDRRRDARLHRAAPDLLMGRRSGPPAPAARAGHCCVAAMGPFRARSQIGGIRRPRVSLPGGSARMPVRDFTRARHANRQPRPHPAPFRGSPRTSSVNPFPHPLLQFVQHEPSQASYRPDRRRPARRQAGIHPCRPERPAGRMGQHHRRHACASVPAIQAALDAGAAVMVTSHLGRPTEGEFKPEDSLAPVAKRLAELLGRDVPLVSNWVENGVNVAPGVVLLENCRVNKGEKKNSDGSRRRWRSSATCT